MEFSSTIRIGDLNDYIAPSQDCVVALNGKLRAGETSSALSEEVHVRPRQRSQQQQQPQGTPGSGIGLGPPQGGPNNTPGDPVKVSLHDCLACSGCITSAETVLLQQQSGEEFLAKLADPRVAVVVTVSPQSRAALAAYFGLSPAACMARLVGWLKWLGVRAVWDLTTARDCVLLEEAAEFVERYRSSTGAGSSGRPGEHNVGGSSTAAAGGGAGSGPLPVMASSCPGWVCYAEKTHGSRVLPHLSSTRSPQGAMGGLVKSLVASAWGVTPGSLYHVSVMPCYDKKLEASRDELTMTVGTTTTASTANTATTDDAMAVDGGDVGSSGAEQVATRIPEVDCCLTTGEVLQLLQQRPPPGCEQGGDVGGSNSSGSPTQGVLLAHPAAPASPPDPILPGVAADDQLYGMQYGSSSGGYADFVFRVATRELCGVEVPPGPLPWRTLRNADFQELCLEVPGGPGGPSPSPAFGALPHGLGPGQEGRGGAQGGGALRFARVYGFRNIQTLLRQVKMGRCAYHYVEVMACPSGCLNGGGQIKPGPGLSAAQLLEQLEGVYTHQDVAARSPADNPAVAALYGTWLGGRPGSAAARLLLHTSFREREKTVTTASVANW